MNLEIDILRLPTGKSEEPHNNIAIGPSILLGLIPISAIIEISLASRYPLEVFML